jgi:hypothetical protein
MSDEKFSCKKAEREEEKLESFFISVAAALF